MYYSKLVCMLAGWCKRTEIIDLDSLTCEEIGHAHHPRPLSPQSVELAYWRDYDQLALTKNPFPERSLLCNSVDKCIYDNETYQCMNYVDYFRELFYDDPFPILPWSDYFEQQQPYDEEDDEDEDSLNDRFMIRRMSYPDIN